MWGIDSFLIAAEESRYNARHWLRYLGKIITREGCLLSEQECQILCTSERLTRFQRFALREALVTGTAIWELVVEQNEPVQFVRSRHLVNVLFNDE